MSIRNPHSGAPPSKPLFNGMTAGTGTTNNSIGSQIAQIITTGIALRKFHAAAEAENKLNNPQEPDEGVRLQESADPKQKIPVVYGKAFLSGKLTDVRMSSDNQKMWYCLTLCEKTGTRLSTGTASTISFNKLYYNDNEVTFKSDGVTIDYMNDRDGNVDSSLRDLVKIYCFNGGSLSPTNVGSSTTPSDYAYQLGTGTLLWTSAHTMNDLVFMLVEVTYDKEKNSTGLGNIVVELENNMYKPADCIYDLMTNTRYGAGIAASDIDT
jgi:hypothetical protein